MKDALPGHTDRKYTEHALKGLRCEKLGDVEVNIAAEVQLIYAPFLRRGRIKSHLHYKVVRCKSANELVRDAAAKYTVSEEEAACIEEIRRIVR